jgi:hypothetical protein
MPSLLLFSPLLNLLQRKAMMATPHPKIASPKIASPTPFPSARTTTPAIMSTIASSAREGIDVPPWKILHGVYVLRFLGVLRIYFYSAWAVAPWALAPSSSQFSLWRLWHYYGIMAIYAA